MKTKETYIFSGYGSNGLYGLGVDAESQAEAIRLLGEKLEPRELVFGVLEVDSKPVCVCGIAGKEEKDAKKQTGT